MNMENKPLAEVTEWELVYDSYHRPVIKNNVRNTLLIKLDIEEDRAIVNNKLILRKNNCLNINTRYKDINVENLNKWLSS